MPDPRSGPGDGGRRLTSTRVEPTSSPGDTEGCCARGADACVFDKALLVRAASCAQVQRRALAEREWLACASPTGRLNCGTLHALLRERSTFALRLPRGPIVHAQALRLQCGGLQALRQVVDAPDDDVHALVGLAQRRYGSLLDLPWTEVVPGVVAWQPRRRHRPGAPR